MHRVPLACPDRVGRVSSRVLACPLVKTGQDTSEACPTRIGRVSGACPRPIRVRHGYAAIFGVSVLPSPTQYEAKRTKLSEGIEKALNEKEKEKMQFCVGGMSGLKTSKKQSKCKRMIRRTHGSTGSEATMEESLVEVTITQSFAMAEEASLTMPPSFPC